MANAFVCPCRFRLVGLGLSPAASVRAWSGCANRERGLVFHGVRSWLRRAAPRPHVIATRCPAGGVGVRLLSTARLSARPWGTQRDKGGRVSCWGRSRSEPGSDLGAASQLGSLLPALSTGAPEQLGPVRRALAVGRARAALGPEGISSEFSPVEVSARGSRHCNP